MSALYHSLSFAGSTQAAQFGCTSGADRIHPPCALRWTTLHPHFRYPMGKLAGRRVAANRTSPSGANHDFTIHAKTIVVTGATSGIGLATAEELVRQGADVIGVGRSTQRCRAAEQRLRSLNPAADVTYCTADLTLPERGAPAGGDDRQLTAGRGRAAVDGLVNNAGAFTYWLTLTPEGFETQWALHHLAPFLLTQELLPLLQAAPAAASSRSARARTTTPSLNWSDIQLRRRYNGLQAYKQTKLANVLFTAELNRRLGGQSACGPSPPIPAW